MKTTVVPQELLGAPYFQNSISVDSINIIESCTHTVDKKGSMFLKEHMLLFVLEGSNEITYGGKSYMVQKNEMVLFKKNISFDYHKKGNSSSNHHYDSIMFFIKDDFIIEFLKVAKIENVKTEEMASVNVKTVKEPILSFITSIKPYFNFPENIDKGLIKIKIIELLYDLASIDKNLLHQLIQLKKQIVRDISEVIEENYTNPLSLNDFAYLSGRSLSSFKRDFYMIYNTTPATFIKEKRLLKAQQMLIGTNFPVKEICYTVGFESLAHFSREYKKYFGSTPKNSRTIVE